jgi:DNA polymerase III sliding clamp (beta) subunit (PCNA family)
MTFAVKAQDFAGIIEKAMRGLNSKIQNIPLDIVGEKGYLTAIGKSPELIAEARCKYEGGEVKFCLPVDGKQGEQIRSLESLKSDLSVTLPDDDSFKLTIKAKSGQYKMIYAPFEGEESKAIEGSKLILKCAMLKEAIEKTLPYTGKDNLRPAMEGIHYEFDDILKFITTDGHKLSIYKREGSGEGDGHNFTIDRAAMGVIKSLIAGEDCEMEISPTWIGFYFENVRIKTRTIAQQYPDYKSVINLNNTIELKFEKRKMLGAIQSLLPLLDIADKGKLTYKNGELRLAINNETHGESYCTCEAECNKDFTVYYNLGYLKSILDSIDAENINVKLYDMGDPEKFINRAAILEGEKNEKQFYLLMPLRG